MSKVQTICTVFVVMLASLVAHQQATWAQEKQYFKPQEAIVTTTDVARVDVSPASFVIMGSANPGDFKLKIHMDGRVEFGAGVTPNDAAKAFAKALYEMGGVNGYVRDNVCTAPPTKAGQ